MRSLLVTFEAAEEITGDDKQTCLKQLRERLTALSDERLDGTTLDVGYKEYRRIVSAAHGGEDLGMEKPWGVEVAENGVGETRQFDTRKEAVDYFLRCASDNGDHWD